MKNIHKKLSVHLSKTGTNGELRTPLNFVTFTNENKSDIISVFPGELPAFKYVLLCSCSHMHSNWLQHGFYWFKTLSCQDKHKYTKIKILKALLFLKIWIDTEVSIFFLNITLAFLVLQLSILFFVQMTFPVSDWASLTLQLLLHAWGDILVVFQIYLDPCVALQYVTKKQ